MALDIADPEDARHIVALGEGHTPLLDYRDHPLAQAAGLALQVKEEGKTQNAKRKTQNALLLRRQSDPEFQGPRHGDGGRAGASAGPDETGGARRHADAILGNVAAAARRHPDRVKLELVGPTIREAGVYLKEHYIPQGYFSVWTAPSFPEAPTLERMEQ